MPPTRVPLILAALCFFSAGPGRSAPTDVAACVDLAPVERADCVRAASLPDRPDRRALDALRKLIDTSAADVERLTRSAASDGSPAAGAADPARAELLELRGLALARLGRGAEASAAVRAAVAIDDGASRLTWRSGDRELWSAALDPGNGRLVRGAQVLIDAGDAPGARAWLAQALAAGAGEPARKLWDQLGGGAIPGLAASAQPLRAPEWFPPLAPVRFRLLNEEGEFDPASVRGKVLLIDFWASWCAPCLRELPELSALEARHRAAGLVVFTVNARETRTAAESTFRSLGIKLPIGMYDDALERAFNVRMLPTLILVDRAGRVRARWDSRVPDIEKDVEAKLRPLLAGAAEDDERSVAEVLAAAEPPAARWTREVSGVVEEAAILGRGNDAIVVTTAEHWLVLDRDGKIARRSKLPEGSGGALIPWAVRDGEVREFLSVRPGREGVARIDAGGKAAPGWKPEGAVLSAAVLAARSDAPRGLVATTRGFGRLGGDGAITPWPATFAEACRLTAISDSAAAAAARNGRLAWFDGEGRLTASATGTADACGPLLSKPGSQEIGSTSASVRDAAVGRWTGAAGWHAAIVTGDDQLVVVDLASGAVRLRARWPGIRAVAMGDTDGDGLDELLVADGRRITLLSNNPAANRADGGSTARVPAKTD